MKMPTGRESLATLLFLSCYSTARAKADPATAAFVKLITTPEAAMRKAVTDRNAALDARVGALAMRDFALDTFHDLIADLARKAYAHYGSRSDPGYAAIFQVPSSTLIATPHRDRPKVWGEFMAHLSGLILPEGLDKLAPPILAAWKQVQAADGGVITANVEVKTKRAIEKAARQSWLVGYDRLHSQISDKFPRDKKRVERYFKSIAKAKAVQDEEEAAPDGLDEVETKANDK